jgi:hypothetical protein
MLRRRSPTLLVPLAALCALAGCGLGAGPAPKNVGLTVTRDFGARLVREAHTPRVVGQETVMSLLQRNFTVATRYGGGFVQSIDGFSGGTQEGEPDAWFYYVNGVEAPKGAADTNVYPGDRIWWDLHDWGQTDSVPAVVGSFPEPFLAGIAGKRLPVRVECEEPSGSACHTVVNRLSSLGVPVALSSLSSDGSPEILCVLVGTLSALLHDPNAPPLERGPGTSGVYARVSSDGGAIALLDATGHTVSTLHAGAGLVAATRYKEQAPVWIITGTDVAGVGLAAKALDEASLHNHFALALAGPGQAVALPDQG